MSGRQLSTKNTGASATFAVGLSAIGACGFIPLLLSNGSSSLLYRVLRRSSELSDLMIDKHVLRVTLALRRALTGVVVLGFPSRSATLNCHENYNDDNLSCPAAIHADVGRGVLRISRGSTQAA